MSPETDSTLCPAYNFSYTLQEEDQYNTRSKRLNYALFYCLGGRLVSMQNFRLIVPLFTGFCMVVACIIVRTISKTGSKRVNDELHTQDEIRFP